MSRALPLVALLLVACGARAASPTTPDAHASSAPATSLDEALARQGLTRAELTQVSRDMTSDLDVALHVEGDHVIAPEQGGWRSSRTIFARRADGTIVAVSPHVNVVVDRHVAGGCQGFAGGRGWFETAEYALPQGATFGGTVEVSYDEHTEVVDYSDTQADGSPCPPPAMD